MTVANGYHTTVTPWIEGDTQAREVLKLVGEDTVYENKWQNQMCCALK
jgi:hypothetical protein